MDETKTLTRLLLVSAIISVVILVGGPLGYKFELAPLQPSLLSLVLSLLIALIVVIVGLVYLAILQKNGLTHNRNILLIALGLSLVPLIAMTPQIIKGQGVPAIHDITTDTVNPPTYQMVVQLRKDALNPLEYGAGLSSPEELARLQQEAYPDVRPLASALMPDDAITRAAEVIAAQGLEIVNVDPASGIVEAVATTFWFGFKDDMVVRVTPTDAGSLIDVRSVSRVGLGDIGANAARIQKFLKAF